MYKLVIFDVDGTLFDTSEGIVSSIKYALDKSGLVVPSNFDYSIFIGPPVQKTIKVVFPNLNDEEVKRFSNHFRSHYKEYDLLKATPYPDLYDILDALKNNDIKIAVGTYKREDYAYEIVDYFGITKYTKNIHGQDFDGIRTKTDILKLCLEEAGVSASEALMVGDTDSDGIAAQEAGIPFLEVDFGFGFNKNKHFSGPRVGEINSFDEFSLFTSANNGL